MTDPAATFAAAYTSALTIEFLKGVGKEAAAATGKLFGWAKAKLTGRAAESLDKLAREPDSAKRTSSFQTDLEDLLGESPELLAELRALLPETAAGGTAINQTLAGTGANVVGNGNTVNIR